MSLFLSDLAPLKHVAEDDILNWDCPQYLLPAVYVDVDGEDSRNNEQKNDEFGSVPSCIAHRTTYSDDCQYCQLKRKYLEFLETNPSRRKNIQQPLSVTKKKRVKKLEEEFIDAVASTDIVKLSEILDNQNKKIDVNCVDVYRRSPLLIASLQRHPQAREVIQLLLQNKADVNIVHKPDGNTALMYAAAHGSLDSVLLLIDAGADMSLRNDEGITAAEWAHARDRLEIVEYLNVLAELLPGHSSLLIHLPPEISLIVNQYCQQRHISHCTQREHDSQILNEQKQSTNQMPSEHIKFQHKLASSCEISPPNANCVDTEITDIGCKTGIPSSSSPLPSAPPSSVSALTTAISSVPSISTSAPSTSSVSTSTTSCTSLTSVHVRTNWHEEEMFRHAAMKLGLDPAILAHLRGTASPNNFSTNSEDVSTPQIDHEDFWETMLPSNTEDVENEHLPKLYSKVSRIEIIREYTNTNQASTSCCSVEIQTVNHAQDNKRSVLDDVFGGEIDLDSDDDSINLTSLSDDVAPSSLNLIPQLEKLENDRKRKEHLQNFFKLIDEGEVDKIRLILPHSQAKVQQNILQCPNESDTSKSKNNSTNKKSIEIDANSVDLDGNSALMHACQSRNLNMVNCLLACSADVHLFNPDTFLTPLKQAVSLGDIDLAKLLLEHKADPSRTFPDNHDDEDNNAFDYATMMGLDSFIALFEQYQPSQHILIDQEKGDQ